MPKLPTSTATQAPLDRVLAPHGLARLAGCNAGVVWRLKPDCRSPRRTWWMATPTGCPDRESDRPALQIVADSDDDLLCRVAERDLEAFEALYRRYARPMFGFALRRLRDAHRAEDAVQEVFTAVWRSASTYRTERGHAAPWLFRVAHNVVVDVHRAGTRERVDIVSDPPELASADAAPDETAERAWVAFCVHAAIAELPERERVPLELAYWRGRTQSEIAHELDLPIGTVKTRTRSGLAHLAARLEGTL
jgi:RNA polymerase sigma-70 factor (ECF subfamily)